MGSWNSRKGFEWKFSLSLWTFLAAAIRLLPHKESFRLWMILIPVGLHARYLFGLWHANRYDKHRAFHFREQAESIMADPSHTLKSPDESDEKRPQILWEFIKDWSMQFQILTTVSLSFAVWYFSNSSAPVPVKQTADVIDILLRAVKP
jgi:hypothetical protein